jgi:acyl-CoA-binding protein
MQEDFDAAAERIKNQPGPDNDEMLELYGLFKQATVGDNTTRERDGVAGCLGGLPPTIWTQALQAAGGLC